jgi:putative Ig domain-containing protein
MKLNSLLSGVAVALCTVAPLTAQTLTSWDSPIKVTASDGSLTKSAGCEGCPDSGAHSATQLTADGYAEFVPAAGQRIIAGLSADLSASTDSSTIDYGFSLWPGGTWELRERGVYRTEGPWAAGDVFRVAVESGKVVYRKNGAVVYTSTVAPAFPMALDVTLYSVGASLSQATVVAGAGSYTPPPPPPPPPSGSGPVVTSVGPYAAVVDRQTYAKPALPVLAMAGATAIDPVFQSPIMRVTDSTTRPGYLNQSYRTPSATHQNTWSARESYFYVTSGDGTVIPYRFDQTTGVAQRINPTATGHGGMTLTFYIEPQFSYVSDSLIYGSYSGSGGNLHSIDQYDFATSSYSRLLDLETLVPGLAGTYIGGIGSSAGQTERLMAFFGGTQQDKHYYVIVFDKANPANRTILDTHASTVNGAPTAIPLNYSLHHVAIDRSGRYLMLYPTSADQSGTRKAPQSVVWDTQTNTFTELGVSAHPYGHDAFGYGMSVNQDCCTLTSYDAAQWQFRSLANPLATQDLIKNVLLPKVVYMADHATWNNAQPDRQTPFISGLYRYGTDTTAARAWDDEIVAVQTDAPAGADATVWRFAHHRSDVRNDLDPARSSFWYMPRPNVSPDGRWVLFTSNWEKTLGVDPTGDVGSGARQDVFLLKLTSSDGTTASPPPPPPPAVVPVTIDTASLPSGRATVAYTATVHATGGTGTYTWSVTAGALPAGVSLNPATGAISGTPSAAGTFSVTVSAADATDATNTATAAYTIAIGAAPVRVTTTSLPAGRETIAYTASEQAAGGGGSFTWSAVSGLPAGLTLNTGSGTVSGTPTLAGTYTVIVTATDAADATNTASVTSSLTIGAAVKIISPRTLPMASRNVAYSYTVQASNVQGTAIWSLAGGSLPPGMTLDATTGVLSGKPTKQGTFNFNVRVKDVNTDDTLTLTLQVKQ